MVFPQHSDCQDVAVSPQIRVWGILFCCCLLSTDRCAFACGDLTGILYLKPKDDESTGLVYTGFLEELEYLKIETRLIDEKFPSVMGECVI